MALRKGFLLIFLFLIGKHLQAQVLQDSVSLPNAQQIKIEHADSLKGAQINENKAYTRLMGNVKITHNEIILTCDSAHWYDQINFIKTFGNVHIDKAGVSSAHADYMEYNGATSQSIMKNNVQIYDGGNTLITDDLSYNLKSKIGIYTHGGTLNSDATTVSSDYGKYNGMSKLAYFKGNVSINNPDNEIESDELNYNTKSKEMKFLAHTIIYGNESVIETQGGTYNEISGLAVFKKRTQVENSEQLIIADKINYNQKTGSGSAQGKVLILDKNDNSTLYCSKVVYDKATGYGFASGEIDYLDTTKKRFLQAGKLYYNEFNKFLMAVEKPILLNLSEDGDSTFIKADSIFNIKPEHVPLLYESIGKKENKNLKLLVEKQEDNGLDEKLFIFHHEVNVFNDSMQATCDSMAYAQLDSCFRMYKEPLLWNASKQMSGDTIFLFTKGQALDHIQVLENAFVINSSGYDKMFDQLKGKNLWAYTKDNQLQHIHITGNAESIYYSQNDDGLYEGMNTSTAAEMKIWFEDKKVKRLALYENTEGTAYPMEKIPEDKRFLSNFNWQEKNRPTRKDFDYK